MKKILGFILLQLCVAVTVLQAQGNGVCGTPTTPSKWTEDYLSNRGAYPKSDELIYVPLTIHIVGKDDGSGYIRVKSVLDALCSLNEDYAPANVQFYIQGDIRYINKSSLFNTQGTGGNGFRSYRVENTINCYMVGTIESSDGGIILAYSNGIPSSEVILRNSTISSGDPTWAHELGHSMGLYHTFYGWESFEHNYTQNAPATVNYNRAVELVDESNCETSGDGICDTSPDYLSDGPWTCNAEGQSNTVQRDPSGTTFRSNGRNFMSYSSNNCQSYFTEEQIQVMRTNLTTSKRNFINKLPPLPSIDSIKPVLSSPQPGDTVLFTAATLEWAAIPGATDYIVEVSRISSFAATLTETYYTTTNLLPLTDLANNRTYYWRVKAYNRNSFCGSISTTGTFRAGTPATTGVDDLTTKANFRVFPNPLADNQTLNMESNLPESTRLNVRLFDLAGKLLQTADYDAIAGKNRLQFTPNKLPKGIYVLNIIGDKINVTEKIVIQ